MAAATRRAYAVATNGQAVFWALYDDAGVGYTHIHRLEYDAKDVASPQSLTQFDGYVVNLVADCKHVYFAIRGLGPETIQRAAVINNDAMSPPPEVVDPSLAAEEVTAMTVDDQFLYFGGRYGNSFQLRAWRKDGGQEAQTVDTTNGPITGIVVHDKRLYWIDAGSSVVNPGQIKGANIPAPGDNWMPQLIRKNAGTGQSLAVDGANVYWIQAGDIVPGDLRVRKAPNKLAPPGNVLDGPDQALAVRDKPGISNLPANWLAVDDNYVYFVDEDKIGGVGSIARVQKNGPPTTKLTIAAKPDFTAYSLVYDAHRIYIASPGGGMDSVSQVLWVAK